MKSTTDKDKRCNSMTNVMTSFFNSQLKSEWLCPVWWSSGQSSAADKKATQARLRCFKVEEIARKFLESSSQSGWSLRNIYISNDNIGSFPFYVYIFFHLTPTRILPHLSILVLPILDRVRNISPVCPLETIHFYKIVFVCLLKPVLYFCQA